MSHTVCANVLHSHIFVFQGHILFTIYDYERSLSDKIKSIKISCSFGKGSYI